MSETAHELLILAAWLETSGIFCSASRLVREAKAEINRLRTALAAAERERDLFREQKQILSRVMCDEDDKILAVIMETHRRP